MKGGLRRASRGLQGGLRRASRGLEKGFKRGFKPFSPSCPPLPWGGPFKPPLKGTFEGGGSDPAPAAASADVKIYLVQRREIRRCRVLIFVLVTDSQFVCAYFGDTCLTLSCLEAPVLYCFAVFSAGETQIWPGDLRVVAGAVFGCLKPDRVRLEELLVVWSDLRLCQGEKPLGNF